jgi:hypothetical protein
LTCFNFKLSLLQLSLFLDWIARNSQLNSDNTSKYRSLVSAFQTDFTMTGEPYIYAPPSRYSAWDPYNGFNPKAVSQASLVPQPQRQKPDGPLINFNQHPDRHLIRPLPQTVVQPMHPNTKKRVDRARVVQLAFRVLQIVGAIGMLILVICLKGANTTAGWIMRIPVSTTVGFLGVEVRLLIPSYSPP